jgi:hypothetical protein
MTVKEIGSPWKRGGLLLYLPEGRLMAIKPAPANPVGVLDRLQTCVRILMEAQGKFRTRMDRATFALVTLRPDDFSEKLRGRATKVLSARNAVRQDYVTDSLFHFEKLTVRERKALISDIIALYEGCLIDVGKSGDKYDFLYPKDR